MMLLFLSVAQSVSAQTSEADLRSLFESRDKDIKKLVGEKGTDYTQEQRDELKDMINGIIDFEAMAQYALDETYETLSEEQKTEFVGLFSTIIRDQSLNNLDIYRAKITYNTIEITDNLAKMETLAELDDVRTPVYYDLAFKNSEWVITDLIIDDVSTAKTYHRQFQRQIRRRGYDALVSSLRKRAARS